jgi:hypothetical protein
MRIPGFTAEVVLNTSSLSHRGRYDENLVEASNRTKTVEPQRWWHTALCMLVTAEAPEIFWPACAALWDR